MQLFAMYTAGLSSGLGALWLLILFGFWDAVGPQGCGQAGALAESMALQPLRRSMLLQMLQALPTTRPMLPDEEAHTC